MMLRICLALVTSGTLVLVAGCILLDWTPWLLAIPMSLVVIPTIGIIGTFIWVGTKAMEFEQDGYDAV